MVTPRSLCGHDNEKKGMTLIFVIGYHIIDISSIRETHNPVESMQKKSPNRQNRKNLF